MTVSPFIYRVFLVFQGGLSIVKQASMLGVKDIVISGGEPLLWDGLGALIKECELLGLKTTLYTSGNKDNFDAMALDFKKHGLSKVIFSIFAGSSDVHEKITRIAGSFDQTLRAVKVAVSKNLTPEFHFVPFPSNYMELPEILKIAKVNNIKKVSVLRFVPQGRGAITKNLILSQNENLKLRKMIKDGEKIISVRVGSPYNFLMVNDVPKCNAAIDRLIVGPDLDIYPCDAFKQIRACEIVKTDKYSRLDKYDLKSCWSSSPYLNVIRKYLSTAFEKPCAKCDDLNKCLSGCLAQKFLFNGDLRKDVDPKCLNS